jgi:hypothetical protein
MISSRALLEQDEDRAVWQTKHKYWGAKNSVHQIRYFHKREDAVKFARGEIKGPIVGRPEPKEHPHHCEPIQHYSL